MNSLGYNTTYGNIEVLHISMDLNQNFDYEGGDHLELGLFNDSSPVVGSISMPITLVLSESFVMSSNLDLYTIDVAWELLKVQLIHNLKN